MNIPALIGVDFDDAVDGKMGIVDGYTGTFYVDPDEETMAQYEVLQVERSRIGLTLAIRN